MNEIEELTRKKEALIRDIEETKKSIINQERDISNMNESDGLIEKARSLKNYDEEIVQYFEKELEDINLLLKKKTESLKKKDTNVDQEKEKKIIDNTLLLELNNNILELKSEIFLIKEKIVSLGEKVDHLCADRYLD